MKRYIHRELDNGWHEIFDTAKREQVERSTNLIYVLNRMAFLNRQQTDKVKDMVYEGRRKGKLSVLAACRKMETVEIEKPEPDVIRQTLYPDAAA